MASSTDAGARRLGALGIARVMLGGWWDRLRGRLKPSACPVSMAGALEMPGRRLVAAPEKVLAAFGIREGDRVVEIGTGTGFYAVEAARRVGTRGRMICLDVQLEMLKQTRCRVQGSGFEALFAVADARSLPLRAASVDHVFLVTVLGEIPDRPRALREIRRVLLPGGHLSIAEQFPDPDFVPRAALRRAVRAAGFVEERTRGWLFYTSTWSSPSAGADQPPGASASRVSTFGTFRSGGARLGPGSRWHGKCRARVRQSREEPHPARCVAVGARLAGLHETCGGRDALSFVTCGGWERRSWCWQCWSRSAPARAYRKRPKPQASRVAARTRQACTPHLPSAAAPCMGPRSRR